MDLSQTVLQSKRLSFGLWRNEHIDEVFEFHRPIEVYNFLSGREETREDAGRRIERWTEDFQKHGFCKFRLTDRETGQFIGRAGFGVHEEMPEIGYALKPQFWGKGFALEAAMALRDWMFSVRDVQFFIGYAYSANNASTRILEKIGMKFTHHEMNEGKQLSFYKLTKEQWHG